MSRRIKVQGQDLRSGDNVIGLGIVDHVWYRSDTRRGGFELEDGYVFDFWVEQEFMVEED